MATIAAWDAGAPPAISGSAITAETGGATFDEYLQVTHDGTAATFAEFSYGAVTETAIRFYIEIPATFPDTTSAISAVRHTPTGFASKLSLGGAPTLDGAVRFFATAGALVDQSADDLLAVSTWYRFEHLIDHTGGLGRVGVFALESDTPAYDSGWLAGNFHAQSVITEIGATAGATPLMAPFKLAHIQITDDATTWVGRHAEDAPAPPSGAQIGGFWNNATQTYTEFV